MGIFSDNFNRANGGLGSNWTQFGGESAPQIYSNAVGYPTNQTPGSACWVGGSYGMDQFSQATIVGVLPSGTDGHIWQVRVRHSLSVSDNYSGGFSWDFNGNSAVYFISKWNSGVQSALATSAQTAALNDVVKIQIIGSALTLFVNGISILTASDTSYATGDIGFGTKGNNQTIGILDDWSGGDIVTAPNPDLTPGSPVVYQSWSPWSH